MFGTDRVMRGSHSIEIMKKLKDNLKKSAW